MTASSLPGRIPGYKEIHGKVKLSGSKPEVPSSELERLTSELQIPSSELERLTSELEVSSSRLETSGSRLERLTSRPGVPGYEHGKPSSRGEV
jgi:hypothetical protein